jgi:hypothetical protein
LLRALLTRPRLLLGPKRPARRFGSSTAALPDDLQEQLDTLATTRGAVREAVAGAVDDYVHLCQLLLGPGSGASPVEDAALLAAAETTLRSILDRAPRVAALAAIAARRSRDRAGRAAAGDAMLHLRDQARALHDTTSAALRWTAERDADSADALRACADHLYRVTHLAERTRPDQ